MGGLDSWRLRQNKKFNPFHRPARGAVVELSVGLHRSLAADAGLATLVITTALCK